MRTFTLSQYFSGIAAKRLSDVEVNPQASNQHEFNGITEMKDIFGTEKKSFDAVFIYLSDNEDNIIHSQGSLSWYDARENDQTRTAEYRLYYSSNQVMEIFYIIEL